MEKKIFLSFIEKYSLGGAVESVVWESSDGKLKTRFVSENRDVLGEISYNGFNESSFYGHKIGLFKTSDLVRKLGVVQDTVDVSLTFVGERPVAMKMSDDDGLNVKQPLSDLTIIKSVPSLKHVPEQFEVELKLTDKFSNKFIKCKNALPDEKLLTVHTSGKNVQLVIGKTDVNSDTITFSKVEANSSEHIDDVKFNADLFKQILSSNKGVDGTFKISKEGLAIVEYTCDEYTARYFLVAKTDGE